MAETKALLKAKLREKMKKKKKKRPREDEAGEEDKATEEEAKESSSKTAGSVGSDVREKKKKKKKKRPREEVEETEPKETASPSSKTASLEPSALREKEKKEKKGSPEDDPSSSEGASPSSRTVYVEGLPYESSEEKVLSLFGRFGEAVVRMPRYQDSGRSRGYAHVEYESVEAAQKALTLDKATMGGRYLRVSRAKAPTRDAKVAQLTTKAAPGGCRTVFVGNLPYDANVDVVRNAFAKFGSIDDVRLPLWHQAQRAKGIAYVQFKRHVDAARAVKEQRGLQVRGRPLLVDYDLSQGPKASFRTTSGQPWAKTRAGKRTRRADRARAADA